MLIYKEILNDILNNMPSIPPEAGGIIGGKDRHVCIWEFDEGSFAKGCMYYPNVKHLNTLINTWIENDYDFMGILHVHFGGAKALSIGDKKYIEKIMNAMPYSINQLYFPIIVQPTKEFISYKAIRTMQQNVVITPDKVKVI